MVVPVLNERRAISGMIKHLSALDADELIIVDGGSSDGTCDILAASDVRWITTGPGRARQMNAGASICKSDILLFIHVDTLISSSNLMAVEKVMCDAAFVGGHFDVTLSGRNVAFRMIEWMMNQRSRLTRISTGDQCQFVRRSLFESMGGFPELALMEDIAFSTLLKRQGRIACLKEKVITSSRRWEQHGIARTVLLMWKLRFLYWLKRPASELALVYRNAR
ncbi:N-glycosyltransferase [Mariprofundus micogutta]|uniref:N-glycosyltransferase n=1 Tax=Mariprofundus micogutta TaxID=1921010 RepID=A0A1L8CLP2_9PROT|nr:N-glycosyltransferase [Mariprofundus micogutta]